MPYFGCKTEWLPRYEMPLNPGDSCEVCGALCGLDRKMRGGAIREGSNLVCGGCCRHGKDNPYPLPEDRSTVDDINQTHRIPPRREKKNRHG